MSALSKKLAIIIAADDKTKSATASAAGNVRSVGDAAKDASAKLLLITEGINKLQDMFDNFIGPAVNFERTIQQSAVGMGLSADEADNLKDSIEELGETTIGAVYTEVELADAFRKVAAEGRGVAGSMEIMEHAMNLAYSTGEDMVETTNQLENIMSAWALTVEDAARISDVLLTTWQNTGAEVSVLTPQLAQMGQLMKGLGMSLEEGSALIGVFADVGVTGVTGLLSAFTQLANTESIAAKRLAEVGISALDAAGNLKTPVILFNDLAAAGLSATDALAMFGIRGSSSMIAAINNISTVGVVMEENLAAAGVAADAAGQVADSSAGDYDKFAASVEDLKLELAEGLLPAMSKLFEVITPIFKLIGEHPEAIYALVAGYVAWKVATLAVTLMNAAQAVSWWSLTVAMLANPIFWIVAVVMAVVLWWDKLSGALGYAQDAFEKLGAWLGGGFRAAWDGMSAGVKGWGKSAGKWISTGLLSAQDSIVDAGEKIAGWISDRIGAAGDFYGKMNDWGWEAGKWFANGLKRAKDTIVDACKRLGGWIKDHLGFSSPPALGPLHDIPEWGEHLTESYAGGLLAGLPALDAALLVLGATVNNRFSEVEELVLAGVEDITAAWTAAGAAATKTTVTGMEFLYISNPYAMRATSEEYIQTVRDGATKLVAEIEAAEEKLWNQVLNLQQKRNDAYLAENQGLVDELTYDIMAMTDQVNVLFDERMRILDLASEREVEALEAMRQAADDAAEAARWDISELDYMMSMAEVMAGLGDKTEAAVGQWADFWDVDPSAAMAFLERFLVQSEVMQQEIENGTYQSGADAVAAWVAGLESAGFQMSEGIFNLIKEYVEAYMKFESPPKAGPMRDIDKWARPLPKTWARGIEDGAADVARSVATVAGPVAAGLGPGSGAAHGRPAPLIQIFVDGREGVEDPAARRIALHIREVLA